MIFYRTNLVEINPFHTTGLFLYPLKTENMRFGGVLDRDQWYEIG